MCEEKYNGYTNYQTWLVALWIDNEQLYLDDIQDMAWKNRDSPYEFAECIKAYVEDMPDVSRAIDNGGMVADLVNSTLSDVNWDELAEMYIKEYRENNPEEVE